MKEHEVLAGVARCTECQPVNQKVTNLIPSQGTCLGLQARSSVGGVREATSQLYLFHINVSPSLSHFLPSLYINKQNIKKKKEKSKYIQDPSKKLESGDKKKGKNNTCPIIPRHLLKVKYRLDKLTNQKKPIYMWGLDIWQQNPGNHSHWERRSI